MVPIWTMEISIVGLEGLLLMVDRDLVTRLEGVTGTDTEGPPLSTSPSHWGCCRPYRELASKNFLNHWTNSKLSWNLPLTSLSTGTICLIDKRKGIKLDYFIYPCMIVWTLWTPSALKAILTSWKFWMYSYSKLDSNLTFFKCMHPEDCNWITISIELICICIYPETECPWAGSRRPRSTAAQSWWGLSPGSSWPRTGARVLTSWELSLTCWTHSPPLGPCSQSSSPPVSVLQMRGLKNWEQVKYFNTIFRCCNRQG